jgi:cytochrome oxidase Cu insertion factor (SCO1/SenC/PrrC family)
MAVAGVAVIFVALALTTTQSQNTELLQSTLAAAPITKLVTENGKTVSSQSLWKEVKTILAIFYDF